MGEPIGPWCDRGFTNAAVLEELASKDPEVAAGVLTNPNLPTGAYLRIVGQLKFTAELVRHLGPANLLFGRPAPEQVALVLAVVARSRAAAEALCPNLTPAAALTLYAKTTTERFKGAASVAEFIRENLARGQYLCTSDKASIRSLIQLVVTETGQVAPYLASLSSIADTREELLTLGPYLTRASEVGPDQEAARLAAVSMVAAAAHGFPDVVRAWAETSDLGVLIAATDPSQSLEFLAGLTVHDPDLQARLDHLRARNLAMLTGDPGARVHATLDEVLQSGSIDDFDTWVDQMRPQVVFAAFAGTDLAELATEQIQTLIEALRYDMPALTALLLFLHPNSADTGLGSITYLDQHALVRRVRDQIVDALRARRDPDGLSGVFGTEGDLVTANRIQVVDNDAAREQLTRSVARHILYAQNDVTRWTGGWRSVYTKCLTEQLTTADQWLLFREKVYWANPQTTAQAVIDEVLAECPAPAQASKPGSHVRYAPLYGNPLGDLD